MPNKYALMYMLRVLIRLLPSQRVYYKNGVTVDNDLRMIACDGKIKVLHMRWLEIRLIIDIGKENSIKHYVK